MGSKKNKNTKQKKGGMKEKVHQVNPFELKINRQKYDILGRKVSKTEKGMPGVSRTKALKKRKETLLVEYRKLGRGNKFVDKRIGERDATMSYDEKMAKRFALERQRELEKMPGKQLLGNDDDDDDDESEEEIEELTHFGQSLSEMENFKDPVLSDIDDDSDDGRINAKVVGAEHFGGFLTKRTSEDAEENEKPKSWKEKMEEVIARSKLAKLERQNEREKTLEAVKNVDSEWKELQMLMSAIKRNRENEAAKAKEGDYDVVMRQLQFDLKAKPTDRLKSEEEIAKEEKERLEKLEADRIRRMLGQPDDDGKNKIKTMSADDLDDGLAFDSVEDEKQADNSGNEGSADAGDSDDSEASGNDDDDDDDGDDDDDDDDDDNDSLSDVEPSDDESEESVSESLPAKKRVRFVDGDVTASVASIVAPKLTKEEIAAASKELPYTFTAPANYSELNELLANRSDGDCLTIIDRVIKCHHPSLAEGNKAKLETICRLLLRYFCDVTRRDTVSRQLLDGLTRFIYNLTQSSPTAAGEELACILFELHKRLFDGSKGHKRKNSFPGLDVLLMFKLASVLFPASDRRHPVITPAMLFMGRILTECPVSSTTDVAAGLFLCTLFADYVALSKRYVPEVIQFLGSVLRMSSTNRKEQDGVLKHQTSAQHKTLLQVSDDCSVDFRIDDITITEVFVNRDNSEYASADKFRLQLIGQCVRLVIIFAEIYRDLPAFNEIFGVIRSYGNCMPADTYPAAVKVLHGEMMQKVITTSAYKPVARPASKPQALKQLEPRIRENFDGRKKLPGSKAAREKAVLKIKTKREFKGALREIRKDTQFIARQKLTDQIERDTERKRKVQKIISDLAVQEGEFRALKKKT